MFWERSPDEPMTKDDILAIKSGYRVIPEVPLTAVNNFICIWDDKFGK